MTGRVQWRRFGFFDKEVVNDNIVAALGCEPTCTVAEGGILLFGDGNGNIAMTDRDFNISWVHKAFSGPVRGVAYVYDILHHRRQYIIAVGEETVRGNAGGESKSRNQETYVIKVFVASDMSRPIQAFHAGNSLLTGEGSTLTQFAVTANGFQIAVGFSSGAVLLFSGNFLVDGSLGRQYVPQVLLPVHKFPVSGLYFCELGQGGTGGSSLSTVSHSSNDRYVRLYVVMGSEPNDQDTSAVPTHSGGGGTTNMDPELAEAGIMVFDTSYSTFGGGGGGAISRTPPRVLDYTGAQAQCSSLMRQTSELVIGREEGVFSYSIEDRGGAAGFEGEKQCVTAVGRYILVGCIDEKTKRTMITIYDLRNKFISMSHLLPLGDTVRLVHHDGGVAYVLTTSWTLIRFQEKDTASKIDVLLRKSLYPLAISLAAEEQSEVAEVIRLYRMYADHLYKKNDFEGAVTQYCHTIGHVQPSYVIRRFLDPQRIGNLTLYLEKLHSRGIATKDHTTLLLTCYTKTHDEAKISSFCHLRQDDSDAAAAVSTTTTSGGGTDSGGSGSGVSGAGSTALNFDVQTAIATLHEASFDEQALSLAIHNSRHEEYIDISLSAHTVHDSQRALAYLVVRVVLPGVADMGEVTHLVQRFGADFLRDTPAAFTGLLVQLCTGTLDKMSLRRLIEDEVTVFSSTADGGGGGDGSGVGEEEEGRGDVWRGAGGSDGEAMEGVCELDVRMDVEDAVAIFSDEAYEKHLMIFLEGVSAGVGTLLPGRVTELLLELYLVEYQSCRCALLDLTGSSGGGASSGSSTGGLIEISNKLKALEDKVIGILDGASSSNSEYDPSSALLLMQAFGFEGGELFLYDKLQSTDLILRRHIETGNERGIMQVLKREGKKDPELFIQVLTYFVRLSMTATTSGGHSGTTPPDTDDEIDDDYDDYEEDEEKWDPISEVLSLVEKESILTPMQIVPILSQNPNLPIHVVSRFIKKSLQRTSDAVSDLEQDVLHMRHLVQSIVQEREASTRTHSKGGGGGGRGVGGVSGGGDVHNIQLGGELRAYEDFDDDDDEFEAQQAEAERETERRKWMNIKKAQLERTGDHESFFAELEHSNDGYDTVATYFGKTIIS